MKATYTKISTTRSSTSFAVSEASPRSMHPFFVPTLRPNFLRFGHDQNLKSLAESTQEKAPPFISRNLKSTAESNQGEAPLFIKMTTPVTAKFPCLTFCPRDRPPCQAPVVLSLHIRALTTSLGAARGCMRMACQARFPKAAVVVWIHSPGPFLLLAGSHSHLFLASTKT